MIYKCPIHNKALHLVPEYQGAMVHSGCIEMFIIIEGNLCILKDRKWIDTKTQEVRIPKEKER